MQESVPCQNFISLIGLVRTRQGSSKMSHSMFKLIYMYIRILIYLNIKIYFTFRNSILSFIYKPHFKWTHVLSLSPSLSFSPSVFTLRPSPYKVFRTPQTVSRRGTYSVRFFNRSTSSRLSTADAFSEVYVFEEFREGDPPVPTFHVGHTFFYCMSAQVGR